MSDNISRQDAIDAIGDEPEVWMDDDEYAKGMKAQWKYDRKAIEDLPSAERVGKWIDMNTKTERYCPRYKCSVCDNWANHSNYCPNCGARMVRGEEDGM